MSNTIVLNTPHPAGRTFLVFSRDGRTVYTGGCDSLVRIWEADSGTDQEPDTALDASDAITALGTSKNSWFSGSEDSMVRSYAKGESDMQSLVTRNNGAVIRCVSVDPEGRRIAVASDETSVKLISLEDTTKIQLLDGHKRGVRSATWHPSGTLLTTCGADGKVIIWDVSGEDVKIEKVLEGLIPTVMDDQSLEFSYDCAALWHTSGLYFIIATKAHEIITISKSTWSKSMAFTNEDCIGATTALALSVNGAYLASACSAGIFVWSTASRKVVGRHEIPQGVTVHQMAFSAAFNMLAWTDSGGNFTRWRDVIPSSLPSPTKQATSISLDAANSRQATNSLFGDNDEPQDAPMGEDDDALAADVDAEEHDDDWIIDDLGGDVMQDKVGKDERGLREFVSVVKAQPTFQPGSTPFHYKRKYLSFNNIGVVEVVDQDEYHIVNVEFHDQSTRKNYHFTDNFKYDLASIGERGIVYACPPEEGHLAYITYKPYSTWASTGEWTYNLPKGEQAIAVAAGGVPPTRSLRKLQEADAEGNGYVAVATDKGLVRFFSGGGIQRGPVWAIDGDIVSMVAGRDYVFVVHREGGTSIDGNQNLKYTLRTSDTYRVMHTGRLPLSKGQTLKWIGITDAGAPVIYDSSERLMILEHFRFTSQGSWAVLLDATKLERRVGKDESYWPIGVLKDTMMCIILKGREEYPGFPRPLAQEIEMRMPYLEMDSAEAQKEERLARETILLDHTRDTLEDDDLTSEEIAKTELDLDKEIIQLIQLACKNGRLQRALDAAQLLHHTASIDMADKVAEFYHLAGLREKLAVLKAVRTEVDRLRNERAQRRDWRSASGPVPTSLNVYVGANPSSSNGLLSNGAAQPVYRPRLASAKPSAEPSPFSRKPATEPYSSSSLSGRSIERTSPPPEKRKREVMTESMDYEDENEQILAEAIPKRQATEMSARFTDQAQKPNPFARKTAVTKETSDVGKPNPFLRKPERTRSLKKSETFFEKVNIAECEAEKGLPVRTKKAAATKQTTLFGLGPGSTSNKVSKNGKDAANENVEVVESQETEAEMAMEEDTENTLISETVTETVKGADSQVETQLDDDEEPIDWPPSPQHAPGELATEP